MRTSVLSGISLPVTRSFSASFSSKTALEKPVISEELATTVGGVTISSFFTAWSIASFSFTGSNSMISATLLSSGVPFVSAGTAAALPAGSDPTVMHTARKAAAFCFIDFFNLLIFSPLLGFFLTFNRIPLSVSPAHPASAGAAGGVFHKSAGFGKHQIPPVSVILMTIIPPVPSLKALQVRKM